MRHLLKTSGIVAGILILFNSCKNDLDLIAPYKETVSVYGLLDPSAKRNYIRINKVFVGQGDATVMAQNADSINYPAGALTVSLERYINGVKSPTTQGNSKTSILLNDTLVQTQSGTFNSAQRLYYTDDKLFPSGEYKLIIQNNTSGANFTAQGVIIDSVKPTGLPPFAPPYYPLPQGSTSGYIDYSNPVVTTRIRYTSIVNARLYSVVMRFHYVDSLTTGQSNEKYMDYTFTNHKSASTAGNEMMEEAFVVADWYRQLAFVINANPVANLDHRRPLYMEYIIYAGAQDFTDFMSVNAPSTTIAQDKAIYTNINGGVGIFSSRSKSSVKKQLKNTFIDSIASSQYTCQLRFYNSSNTWPGCP